jgi:hypothetical protein
MESKRITVSIHESLDRFFALSRKDPQLLTAEKLIEFMWREELEIIDRDKLEDLEDFEEWVG